MIKEDKLYLNTQFLQLSTDVAVIKTRLDVIERQLDNHIKHLQRLGIALVGVIGGLTINLLLKLL